MNGMINSLMGTYSKYIKPVGKDKYELTLPKDLSNPTVDNSYSITLPLAGMMELYSIYSQPHQYYKSYGPDDSRLLSKGDTDFEEDRWAELMLGELNNKYNK